MGIEKCEVPSGLHVSDDKGKRREDKMFAAVRACKTNFLTENSVGFGSYNMGTKSTFREVALPDTIDDLHQLLAEIAAKPERREYLILGRLAPHVQQNPSAPFRRLSNTNKYPRDKLTLLESPTRLVVLDIDSGDIENWNPFAPQPGVQRILETLGPAYAKSDVVVQITASQIPQPGTPARVRLYFLLPQAWAPRDHRAHLCGLIDTHPDLKIDKALWHTGRVVYLSNPLFVSEASAQSYANPFKYQHEDPIPQRWWVVRNAGALFIEKPARGMVVRTLSSKKHSSNGSATSQIIRIPLRALGEELEGLSAHGDAIHAKILDVTFNLSRNQGDRIQTRQVINMIRTGLEALVSDGPLKQRADRIKSPDLDAEIERAYLGELAVFQGRIEAFPPQELLTAKEGSQRLSAVFDEILDGKARQNLVQAAMGLGKTTLLIEKLIKHDMRTDFYVPDHALAMELLVKIERMGGKAVVIHGRSQVVTGEDRYCTKWQLIEAVSKLPGARVPGASELCRRTENGHVVSRCPDADTCAYGQQFRSVPRGTQFVIRAHDYLRSDSSFWDELLEERIANPQVIVIDENPITKLIDRQTFRYQDLVTSANLDGSFAADSRQTILDGLKHGQDVMAILRQYGERIAAQPASFMDELLDPDDPDEVVEREIRYLWLEEKQPASSGLQPSMSATEAIAQISQRGLKSNPWHPLTKLLKNAADNEWKRLNGIRTYRDQDGQLMLEIAGLAPVSRLRKRAHLILIDGSPDTEALRQVFPELRSYDIRVRRNARIVQVKDSIVSDNWLRQHPGRRRDIVMFATLMNLVSPVGVGVRKEFEQEFAAEGLPTLHHGKLRGQNALEPYPALIAVGRLQLRAEAVENEARAIYQDVELKTDCGYHREAAVHHVGNGQLRVFEDMLHVHPDPRVHRRLAHYRENEQAQLVDRARLIHAQQKKLVVMFSAQPLGLDFEVELASLQDILGPDGLMTLFAESSGYLPLNAASLLQRWPDKFNANINTAKDFAKRVRTWAEHDVLGFVQLEPYRTPGARGAPGWSLRWLGWKSSDEQSEQDEMGGSLMSIYKEPTHYSLDLGPNHHQRRLR